MFFPSALILRSREAASRRMLQGTREAHDWTDPMRLTDGCWLYILRCSDGSFYTGTTRNEVDVRVGQHNAGLFPDSYTVRRRPVVLVYSEHFPNIVDAIAMERRVKGWSRRKKQAVIDGNWDLLPELTKTRRRSVRADLAVVPSPLEHPSRRRFAAPQDEG